MLIEINTDKNIEGGQKLSDYFIETLQEALGRFDEKITRIIVHLGDENADRKTDDDKRCLIEARIKNSQPIAITEYANTIQMAVKGATDRMIQALDKIMERRNA